MARHLLILAAVCSAAAQAQFSRTIVAPLTSNALVGSAGLWDGYDNVFYAEGTTLAQRWWNGSSWIVSILDRTANPLYPTCNSGTNGEVSARFISGYHDVFYISHNSVSLRHAWYDYGPGVWRCETIESGTMAHPVAIDMGGVPHVYYVDVTRGVLRHAFWNGTWQKKDIDGLGLSGPDQCNCRVGGLVSTTTKPVAASSFLSTQQVFYSTNHTTSALRYASKYGGGAGGWIIRTIMGPGANVPGFNLPRTTGFSGHVTTTVVGDALHVFGKFTTGVEHLWWSPSTGWRLATNPLTGGAVAFSAAGYLGGWALTSWETTQGYPLGIYKWGQGDNAVSSTFFQSTYGASNASPAWIDSYVGADGYLNVYLTYKTTSGYSTIDQFWR